MTVPCEFGLEGHSDADVLAHAITDAILGAAALGDIGMHFPDTDPRWKGCDSLVFLRHARELAAQRGYRIVNVDSTVILERPKLKDYRQAIRERMAADTGSRSRPRFGQVQDCGKGWARGRRALGRIASRSHPGGAGLRLAGLQQAHAPRGATGFQPFIGLLLLLRGHDGLTGITALPDAGPRDKFRAAAAALFRHGLL